MNLYTFMTNDQTTEKLVIKAINYKDAIKIIRKHSNDFESKNGSVSNLSTTQGLVIDFERKRMFVPYGDKIPITYFGIWKDFGIEEVFEGKELV